MKNEGKAFISIQVDEKLKEQLKAVAENERRSLSNLIECVMTAFLDSLQEQS